MAKAKQSNPAVDYPVRRGARRERLLMDTYRQMVWQGIVESANDYDGDFDSADTWAFGDDNAAMLFKPLVVLPYARLLSYSDRSKNPTLTTVDGKEFSPPSTADGVKGVYTGYIDWLNCDEEMTDAIDQRILLANASLAPGYLADAEEAKKDPNSLSEGVKHNEQ